MALTFLELYRQKVPKIQNWKHIKSLISNFGESFIPFLVNVSMFYLLKKRKTIDFLVMSGGIKWEHWPGNG